MDSVTLFWFGYQLASLSGMRWLLPMSAVVAAQILFSMYALAAVTGALGVLLGSLHARAQRPKLWVLGAVLAALVLGRQGDFAGMALCLALNAGIAARHKTLNATVVLVSMVPLSAFALSGVQRASLIAALGAGGFVYQYYIAKPRE